LSAREDGPVDVLVENPRDAEVLRTIEGERLTVFTFDGLRRITRTHPETLSRALERLEESGAVVRSPEGYSLAERTKGTLPVRRTAPGSKGTSVLHTFLPYPAHSRRIADALKGRWFDNVRWVGMAEEEDGFVMKWVTEDGTALIDARFSSGQLDIEAKVSSDSDLPKAVRAAHQLVGRISRLYGGARPANKAAFARLCCVTPFAM
jgi:hypothetical protein